MTNTARKNRSGIAAGFLYAALFFYVAYRAFHLSFTHDEGLSYTIITGNKAWVETANNHLLNTLLMQLCSALFGDSEIALRLPNVIMFPVYLVFSQRILAKCTNPWLRVAGMCLLLLNPFLLDFFSIARGYGISLGFMMVSLYYLLRHKPHYAMQEAITRDFLGTMFFASLALWANLSTLNYYAAAVVILVLRYLLHLRTKPEIASWRHLPFAGAVLLSVLPAILAARWLLHLDALQQLYFGTDSFDEMTSSMISASAFQSGSSPVFAGIRYVLYAAFGAGILISIRRRDPAAPFFTITALLTIIAGLLVGERFLLRVAYPVERSAIYLIPLFALFLLNFIACVAAQTRKAHWLSAFTGGVLAIAMICNFTMHANLTYTRTWRYDAHTKDVAVYIGRISRHSSYSAGPLTISNDWLFEPALNYYIGSRKLNVRPANRDGVNLRTDFVYDFVKYGNVPPEQALQLFPDNGTGVYKGDENFHPPLPVTF